MPPIIHNNLTPQPAQSRNSTSSDPVERKADRLVRMLQGTMGLEGQALSEAELTRLRLKAKRLLTTR